MKERMNIYLNHALPIKYGNGPVRKSMRRMILLGFLLPLSGCSIQSTLYSSGPAAHRIAVMQWWMLVLFCVATLIMWVLFVWAAKRRPGTLEEHAPIDAGGGHGWVLYGGLISLFILFVLFTWGLVLMRSFPIHNPTHSDTPPDIVVIGHQWWWEVHYLNGPSSPSGTVFVTANEIHIPVNRPVTLELKTADVIHSFWIPALHGKVDMIPGHPNFIRIEASHAGAYQGQCSSYCGKEHALMRLLVIAQPEVQYQTWLKDQRQMGADPTTAQAIQGEQIFLSAQCAKCHTVRGTSAVGIDAPDLTHIGSRRYIASNVFPNNDAYLAAWAVHAQSLKPGALMPNLPNFNGRQLLDMVAYLRQLK